MSTFTSFQLLQTIVFIQKTAITKKRTYVSKGCNFINPYFLTVFLTIPFNKLSCFIPSSTRSNRGKASSLQNQYCMQNDCYTPTEFALFGIGICIAGILIGVIVLAYVKNKCSAEDKLYEYTLDDTHQVSAKETSKGKTHTRGYKN